MNFGKHACAVGRGAIGRGLKAAGLALALLAAPQVAAQAPAQAPAVAASAAPGNQDASVRSTNVVGNPASETTASSETPQQQGGYARMKPTEGKGMPVANGLDVQTQYSPIGEYGAWMHNWLVWVMVIISVFVLGLLLYVMVRFSAKRNPVPSKTSHNTTIEVIWTLVPVLILVGIAVPSIDLLAKQFKPAPEKALTVKVTGNQWFWSYTYPDNGGFEVTSYMLNEPGQPVVNNGVREVGSDPSDGPAQLEVDNRMVLPVGEPIRMQITASDVIHAFAIPSLWFKLDAVPGRINEKVLFIKEPGVYYGQCSELCGAKHGYMPIAIEALPRAQYNAWVLAQSGGKIDGQPEPAADASAAPAAAAAAAPAAAPAPAVVPAAAASSEAAPAASASAGA